MHKIMRYLVVISVLVMLLKDTFHKYIKEEITAIRPPNTKNMNKVESKTKISVKKINDHLHKKQREENCTKIGKDINSVLSIFQRNGIPI